jgi:hypothetical protein
MGRWTVPEKYVVIIGGNKYINCATIIDYKGQHVFELHRSTSDGYLGIDCDLHAKTGQRIGTVRNGVFVPPVPPGYSVHEGPDHYTLTENTTGRVVCDIRLRAQASGDAEIEVAAAQVHVDGNEHGGITMRGNTFSGGGAAIRFG